MRINRLFLSVPALVAILTMPLPAQHRSRDARPGSEPITIDPALAERCLKTYESSGVRFQAGFLPDQAEVVWGEPLHNFMLVIKNTGPAELAFEEGGDYRGGRSENNKISAVDAEGKPVPAPEMSNFGGKVGMKKLGPGDTFIKMLPIERRLTFSGPGIYTVTGSRVLRLGKEFRDPATISISTTNTFQFTIHPYSPERMAAEIARLAAAIRARSAIPARASDYTEATGFSVANQQERDLSTLAAIKDSGALTQLIAMSREGPATLRAAATRKLGSSTAPPALSAVLAALSDADSAIRQAAAGALGEMKSDSAIEALQGALQGAPPEVADSVLRAMGQTHSPRLFEVLTANLMNKDGRRLAAAEGLVAFGGGDALQALKDCATDPDLDFREQIVKLLAESLHQPIEAQWLAPVIKSREGKNAVGDAPRLLRLHGGNRAVPVLLSCLDFGDPSTRKYYNWELIYEQGWCLGGMSIPWISDLNRDSAPGEIAKNTESLRALQAWVDDFYQNRMNEETKPEIRAPADSEKDYGSVVDGVQVRLRVNQRVWPAGMPQMFTCDVLSTNGGSVNVGRVPDPLEVEVNGIWYRREPRLTMPAELQAGHGTRFNNFFLDGNWQSLKDNTPLQLKPGEYTVRVRLSLEGEDKRTGLAESLAVKFKQL